MVFFQSIRVVCSPRIGSIYTFGPGNQVQNRPLELNLRAPARAREPGNCDKNHIHSQVAEISVSVDCTTSFKLM